MIRTLKQALFSLVLAGLGAESAKAAQPLTPASLTPCPYTADEIAAALALAVEPGQAADMQRPGGRDVGCLYAVRGSETAFTVRQTWDPAGAASSTGKGWRRVTGDADHAALKSGGPPGDPGVELVYSRGKVRTRLFVHGPSLNVDAMQPKLLKLRRVP